MPDEKAKYIKLYNKKLQWVKTLIGLRTTKSFKNLHSFLIGIAFRHLSLIIKIFRLFQPYYCHLVYGLLVLLLTQKVLLFVQVPQWKKMGNTPFIISLNLLDLTPLRHQLTKQWQLLNAKLYPYDWPILDSALCATVFKGYFTSLLWYFPITRSAEIQHFLTRPIPCIF